jgi:hypothetical protein
MVVIRSKIDAKEIMETSQTQAKQQNADAELKKQGIGGKGPAPIK